VRTTQLTTPLFFFMSCLFVSGACIEKNTADLIRELESVRDTSDELPTLSLLIARGDAESLKGLIDSYLRTPSSSIYRAIVEFDSRSALPVHLLCLNVSDSRQSREDMLIALQSIDNILRDETTTRLPPEDLSAIDKNIIQYLQKEKNSVADTDNDLKLTAIRTLSIRMKTYPNMPLSNEVSIELMRIAQRSAKQQNFWLARESILLLGTTGEEIVLPLLVESLFRSSKTYGSSFFDARIGLARFGSIAADFLDRVLASKNDQLNRFFKKRDIKDFTRLSRIAISLGDLHTSKAMGLLVAQVTDVHSKRSIRISGILETIGRLGLKQARGQLVLLASDQQANHISRRHALSALRYIGDYRIVSKMIELFLNQSDAREVRYNAIAVAAMLASKKQLQAVSAALNSVSQNTVSARDDTVAEGALKSARIYLDESERCGGELSCFVSALKSESSDVDSINFSAISLLRIRNGYTSLSALAEALGRIADDDKRVVLTVIERLIGHPKSELADLKQLLSVVNGSVRNDTVFENKKKQVFLGDENQLRLRLLSIRLNHIVSDRQASLTQQVAKKKSLKEK